MDINTNLVWNFLNAENVTNLKKLTKINFDKRREFIRLVSEGYNRTEIRENLQMTYSTYKLFNQLIGNAGRNPLFDQF